MFVLMSQNVSYSLVFLLALLSSFKGRFFSAVSLNLRGPDAAPSKRFFFRAPSVAPLGRTGLPRTRLSCCR